MPMDGKEISSPVPGTMIIFFLALSISFHSIHAFTWEEKGIDQLERLEKLTLTSATGPESLAFDHIGRGPYTGVSDGRVLKWNTEERGWAGPYTGVSDGRVLKSNTEKGEWIQFATSPKRRAKCDGNVDDMFEDVCGRPLGLQFYNATGDLYIADATFGLLVVGPKGGVAKILASQADGVPFSFLNGLEIDQENGVVYFTDSSTKLKRRDHIWMVLTNDQTGRLLKYDIKRKKLEVLLRNLPYPNGVSIVGSGGRRNSFLLVAETTPCRVMRYWIEGPRAGTVEVFAELPSYPDNIKKNGNGEFWVALSGDEKFQQGVKVHGVRRPVAVRLSGEGRVLEVLNGGVQTSVSEVGESDGRLWVGSVDKPFVKVYKAQ